MRYVVPAEIFTFVCAQKRIVAVSHRTLDAVALTRDVNALVIERQNPMTNDAAFAQAVQRLADAHGDDDHAIKAATIADYATANFDIELESELNRAFPSMHDLDGSSDMGEALMPKVA